MNVIDHDRIETRGGRRVVIVGEVGARDEQGISPSESAGEAIAERPRSVAVR